MICFIFTKHIIMSDTTKSLLNELQFDTTCITYSNNTEYRAALRRFFNMNPVFCLTGSLDDDAVGVIDEELDPETADELMYDTTTSMKMITAIYEATQHEPLFMDLYLHAAGRIFSEDAIMGLTLLFCYDHFSVFVPFLVNYLNGVSMGNEKFTNEYRELYESV